MKRLIATTAMALALTTGAYADTSFNSFSAEQFENGTHMYATTFIGMRIYASETEMDENFEYTAGAEKEWNDIGEVDDVILNKDGNVEAVILGVGGFLGLGEKDVSVSMDDIRIVREKDDSNDFFLVVKASKQELTDAPSFDRGTQDNARNEAPVTETQPVTGEQQAADSETPEKSEEQMAAASSEREMLRKPAEAPEGYTEASAEGMTEEKLEGIRVYGAKNEDIGEIHDVVMTNGQIDTVVLDIGGFLGLGEHRIGVTMDELKIVQTEDGSEWRAYIDATKEELERQPEYRQRS